ncbi:MAG TPA: hypothetical protein VIP70_01740 [Nitrososphaeraceae archaeon]
MLSLYENHINNNNDSRISIGARGRYSILTSSQEDIASFRKQIKQIYNLIGISNIEQIKKQIKQAELSIINS